MDDSYTTFTARSVGEVEKIRNIWEGMQWHPDGDIDHYLAILESRAEIVRPHVIALYRNEKPEALFVGRIEDVKMDIKLGYQTLIRPKVRSLSVGMGGILGCPTALGCDLLVSELCDVLSRREADLVFLQGLRIDSFIFGAANTKSTWMSRDGSTSPNLHWRIKLPNTYDEYFNSLSKETRRRLRKESNRISKNFGASISLKCYSSADDIDVILQDQERIASKTYHRGLGVGFVDNVETRRRYELALARGLLRSYIIYVENNPVVFLQGICYGSTFYAGTTGYDPQYGYYHPGTYILTRIIEDLCQNEVIEVIDFGLGDAEYKRIYCNEHWEEASVYIFSTSMKMLMIRGARSGVMLLSRLIQNLLKKANLDGRVKTIWRNRVAHGRGTSRTTGVRS